VPGLIGIERMKRRASSGFAGVSKTQPRPHGSQTSNRQPPDGLYPCKGVTSGGAHEAIVSGQGYAMQHRGLAADARLISLEHSDEKARSIP
jgi:hypothetical protein